MKDIKKYSENIQKPVIKSISYKVRATISDEQREQAAARMKAWHASRREKQE